MSCRSSTIEKYHRRLGECGSESLLGLLPWIQPQLDVLDIGTATGALGEILSRERGCRVDGIELDFSAAVVARRHYRRMVLADLDRSNLDELVPAGAYDIVVFADVLEHLEDPASVLGNALGRLRPGSEVLISIPNIAYAPLLAELLSGRFRYRSTGILDETHVHFFTRTSLLEMTTAAGLSVIELKRVRRPLHESEFGTWALEALPEVVRTYLLTREEAGTYQFLARCKARSEVEVDANEPHELRESNVSPPRLEFPISLLWRDETSGYEMGNRVVAWGDLGGGLQVHTLSFEPSEVGGRLGGIRLDLADRAGWVELKSLQLMDLEGETVWAWDAGKESPRSWTREGLVISPVATSEGGVGLLLSERGGSLELPVPPEDLKSFSRGGILEVVISWPLGGEPRLIVEHLKNEMRELLDAEDKIRRLDDQVRFLQSQLAERLDLLRELEAQYLEAVRERDRALESQ